MCPPVASSIQRRVLAETTSVPPQYDLSEGLVGLHQLVRGADLLEWEDAVDHRSESPRIEHRHHALRELTRELDLLLDRARTEHRPDDRQPLAQQQVHLELRGSARRQTNHDGASARRQHPQISIEIISADEVDDRVHAIDTDAGLDCFGPVAPRGIDRNVKAEQPCALQLVGGARRAYDRRARNTRDLQSGGSDAAADGVNENRLAELEPEAVEERVVRGEKDFGN